MAESWASLHARGEHEAALELIDLELLAVHEPSRALVATLFVQGCCLHNLRRYGEALPPLEAALSLGLQLGLGPRECAPVQAALGTCLHHEGLHQEAEGALRMALVAGLSGSRRAEAQLVLGWCLLNLGVPQGALLALNQALASGELASELREDARRAMEMLSPGVK